MKTQSSNLSKLLATIAPSIPNRATLPIIESVLLESDGKTLTATGGNLEQTVSSSIDCDGKFSACVPLVQLKNLVDTLTGEIELTADVEAKRLTVVWATGKSKLNCDNHDEYPAKNVNKGETFTVNAKDFFRVLEHTRWSVSNDELCPAMVGVHLDFKTLAAVATDGHKLAQWGNAVKGVTLPSRASDMIVKLFKDGELTVTQGEQFVTITDGVNTLQTRLIEDAYPNFESVIPPLSQNIVTVNRTAFLTSLKRVALFSNDMTKQVRINFGAMFTTVSAENVDRGNEGRDELPCEHEGEEMELGCNADFIIAALQHIESDKVKLFLTSPSRAMLIKSCDDAELILQLIMPVRLNP